MMAPAVSILATNLRVWATHPITATIATGAAWTGGGAAAVSVDPMLLFGALALVPTLAFARPAVRPRSARPVPAPSSHQTPGAPVPAGTGAGVLGRPDSRPVHVTGDHLSGPAGARLCQCRAFPMARDEIDCPNLDA
jgi:hypothetical protein